MASLLLVADALARVLDGVKPLPKASVPLMDAPGRVLAADLVALRTQPPEDLSAMDGYAALAADVAKVPVTLKVVGEVAAGHAEFGPVAEWDSARVNRMLEVHIGGTFNVCKYVLPVMKARGAGSIVTIASTAGFMANNNNVPYGAAKAGITGLTRQLMLEALPEVRVNCIAPGRTITGMTTPLMMARGGDMERGEKVFGAPVPMGRMAKAGELAAAICFFLSEDASFVTGQTLIVDGGETIS